MIANEQNEHLANVPGRSCAVRGWAWARNVTNGRLADRDAACKSSKVNSQYPKYKDCKANLDSHGLQNAFASQF